MACETAQKMRDLVEKVRMLDDLISDVEKDLRGLRDKRHRVFEEYQLLELERGKR